MASSEKRWVIHEIDPNWSIDELLARDGLFLLDEVAAVLCVTPQILIGAVSEHRDQSSIVKAPGPMGQTRWLVSMKAFRDFYPVFARKIHVCPVDAQWDTNQLLAQKGIFFLAHVARKLPFTSAQMIYRVGKTEDSRRVYGVWRHELGYLVEMPIFARWFKEFWRGEK